MRSRKIHTVSSRGVQTLARAWLSESLKLKDHGWKCTADVIWKVMILAAARDRIAFSQRRLPEYANVPLDLHHGRRDDRRRAGRGAWVCRG
jgi:hypothetical protein